MRAPSPPALAGGSSASSIGCPGRTATPSTGTSAPAACRTACRWSAGPAAVLPVVTTTSTSSSSPSRQARRRARPPCPGRAAAGSSAHRHARSTLAAADPERRGYDQRPAGRRQQLVAQHQQRNPWPPTHLDLVVAGSSEQADGGGVSRVPAASSNSSIPASWRRDGRLCPAAASRRSPQPAATRTPLFRVLCAGSPVRRRAPPPQSRWRRPRHQPAAVPTLARRGPRRRPAKVRRRRSPSRPSPTTRMVAAPPGARTSSAITRPSAAASGTRSAAGGGCAHPTARADSTATGHGVAPLKPGSAGAAGDGRAQPVGGSLRIRPWPTATPSR